LSKETVKELSILIVTWNSAGTIEKVLKELLQEVKDLAAQILVWDNASEDESAQLIESFSEVVLIRSSKNIGYCEAINRLFALAPESSYYLTLNPDALPLPGSIKRLIESVDKDRSVAAATPKLLRSDPSFIATAPAIIDAAGMFFTPQFRHLDRGSGEIDQGQYDTPAYVPGGTGAALLLKGAYLNELALSTREDRLEMLDERFFAYREDAELALRIIRQGYRTRYVPESTFLHVRRVTPERRREIPAELNSISVRNRFLLQDSHFIAEAPTWFRLATGWRNLLVRLATLVSERSSAVGLKEARNLIAESAKLRSSLYSRQQISNREFWRRVSTEIPIRETA
jgi:GT2 family glycosyltransferase